MSEHTEKRAFRDRLREDLRDPEFAQQYAEASEAWDLALQLARLRRERGITQAQLAEMVGTKQQNIARIENPSYSGHSLSLLRKIGRALGMVVRVQFVPTEQALREEGLDTETKPKRIRYSSRSTRRVHSESEASAVRESPPEDE